MEFYDILSDLEIAAEGINTQARSDYKTLNRQVTASTKAIKAAMKAGRYREAIKQCDITISQLNAFKQQIQSSETEGRLAGNAIVAAKSMAKAVLGTLTVLGIAKAGAKVFESIAVLNEYDDDDVALEASRKANKERVKAANAKKRAAKDAKKDVNQNIAASRALIQKQLDASTALNNEIRAKVEAAKKSGSRDFDVRKQIVKYEQTLREEVENEKELRALLKLPDDQFANVMKNAPGFDRSKHAEIEKLTNDELDKHRAASDKFLERANSTAKKRGKFGKALHKKGAQAAAAAANEPEDKQDQTPASTPQNQTPDKPTKEQPVQTPEQKSGDSKPNQTQKPAGANTSNTVHSGGYGGSSKRPGELLSGRNVAIGAVGAGVVTALVSFIKNMSSGKNANITNIIKGIDMSIKSLEAIKASCKRSMQAKESYYDEPMYIWDEYLPTDEAFCVGIVDELLSYGDSLLESFINVGFTDNEATELYMLLV